MENRPNIRVIGNATEEQKERLVKEIHSNLDKGGGLTEKDLELLKRAEQEKTEKELILIRFADQEISRLMEELGLKPYSIPSDNYHLLSSEFYYKYFGKNNNATAKIPQQGIMFDAGTFRDKPVFFGSVAIHETLHLKSHLSMELNEAEGELAPTPYREGVGIKALQRDGFHGNYHEHFSGLHEAIVAETQKKLFDKMLSLPELAAEKTWLESKDAQTKKAAVAKRKKLPEDTIIWVGESEDEKDWEMISYVTQRQVLNYICEEISKNLPEKYPTPEEVYKEFLKAQFTGHLTSIARIIEGTFGEGSFRILGEMKTTKTSGEECLKKLEDLRSNK